MKLFNSMEELYRDKVEQQAAAAAAAAAEADGRPHVYVLTLEADDVLVIDDDGQDGVVGASWVSVHRTKAGADAKLREKCAEWGLLDLLDRDALPHSVSYLPVQE